MWSPSRLTNKSGRQAWFAPRFPRFPGPPALAANQKCGQQRRKPGPSSAPDSRPAPAPGASFSAGGKGPGGGWHGGALSIAVSEGCGGGGAGVCTRGKGQRAGVGRGQTKLWGSGGLQAKWYRGPGRHTSELRQRLGKGAELGSSIGPRTATILIRRRRPWLGWRGPGNGELPAFAGGLVRESSAVLRAGSPQAGSGGNPTSSRRGNRRRRIGERTRFSAAGGGVAVFKRVGRRHAVPVASFRAKGAAHAAPLAFAPSVRHANAAAPTRRRLYHDDARRRKVQTTVREHGTAAARHWADECARASPLVPEF